MLKVRQWFYLFAFVGVLFEGRGAAQQVFGSYYWMNGDATTSASDGRIDPVNAFANPTCTLTAVPKEGEKAIAWMKFVGSNPSLPSSFDLVQDNGSPLVWKNDGNPKVTLGLVCDWIHYQLVYEGMSSTNLVYTNEVAISDCTLTKTGYQFAEAWTNVVGTAFTPRQQVTGADFSLTNHDDSAVVTLYPKWTANKASLRYELGGGFFDAAAKHPDSATYDMPFEVTDPTKIGYGLKEWTIEPQPPASGSRVERLDGATRFLNLFEKDKTTVMLTAVWTACTYKVTFNNHGATSGPDRDLVMTYGSEYAAVNLPLKAGNAFMGYFTEETGGQELWNQEGQPSHAVWELPSDTTAHARWRAATFHIAYNANGGQGTINDLLVTNGVKAVLSTGEGLTFPGCKFLGWSTSATAGMPDYLPGAEITLTRTENLTLYAVWKMPYFVAYDGHGKTSGEMPVQECVRGEEAFFLPNEFAKRGYAFAGWAKTAVGADQLKVDFADRQIIKDMGDVPGATNTVFAVWTTNTYYVAFDKGEGSGEPMDVMEFVYDQTQRLARCTFTPPSELHILAGWRNATDGSLIEDEAIVSNLCAVANGTNTLVAIWKLDVGEWSERMHCTNMVWGLASIREGGSPQWTREGVVAQEGGGWTKKEWLQATVKTNGVLRLQCRWVKTQESADDVTLGVGFVANEDVGDFNSGVQQTATNIVLQSAGNWQTADISVRLQPEEEQTVIRLVNFCVSNVGRIEIDQVEWFPEGTDPGGDEPQPGKDEPTVTGITFENGKIVIRSTGDAKFGYQVLSTLSLTPANWQPESESYQTGQAVGQTFELTVDPAEPQKFFKVEVLKKR